MPNTSRLWRANDIKTKILEDNAIIGYYIFDVATKEIIYSKKMYEIIGIDSNSVVPSTDTIQSIVHVDDQAAFYQTFSLAANLRHSLTFRIIRPDGKLRWVFCKIEPFFNRDGDLIAQIGTLQDISEIHELQSNLAIEKKVIEKLSALLGGHVWRAYPDGRLIETSQWSRLTGQTAAEAREWGYVEAIHPDDRERYRDAWAAAISADGEFEVRVRVKAACGSYICLNEEAVPLHAPSGEILEWIGCSKYAVEEHWGAFSAVLLVPEQIRAARALLNWTANELADAAGISFSTIRRMEVSTRSIRKESLEKVLEIFRINGVQFSGDADGGVAVKLVKTRDGANKH